MGLDSPRPAHLYQNRKFPSNLSSITCGGVLGGAGVAFLSSTCEYRRGSEMIANRFPKWVPKALASRGSPENLFFIKNIFNMREQEWQSACLASMWPGIEFVFGSLPCSERFFSGYSGFPYPQKPIVPNSNLIWNARTSFNEFSWTPEC